MKKKRLKCKCRLLIGPLVHMNRSVTRPNIAHRKVVGDVQDIVSLVVGLQLICFGVFFMRIQGQSRHEVDHHRGFGSGQMVHAQKYWNQGALVGVKLRWIWQNI